VVVAYFTVHPVSIQCATRQDVQCVHAAAEEAAATSGDFNERRKADDHEQDSGRETQTHVLDRRPDIRR